MLEKISDPTIRELLKRKIVSRSEFMEDPTTIVIDEFNICFGCAIADVAVVNGKIHGYEIKSERDNLDRLVHQVEFYNKVFDTVTLVVSETHLPKAEKIIPHWWGIDCVYKKKTKYSLKTIRKPRRNRETDEYELSQLLWKEELIELLKSNGTTKGIKSKTRRQLSLIVKEQISRDVIIDFVRNKLKNRPSWRAVPVQQLYDDLLQL